MYIIIDSFSDISIALQNTLAETGSSITYVILNDDRFLPDGFISIFDYIINNISPLPQDYVDIPLPCVKVPPYYSIFSNTNARGKICHLGQKKGTVWFRNGRPGICADCVERLDENGNIIRLDYYNRYGFIAFSDFYNDKSEATCRSYYSADNKPILDYSYDTDTYCLIQDGHVISTFSGKDALTSYCIATMRSTGERIILTSTKQAHLLMQENLLDKQTDIFLFQSLREYQQYMEDPTLNKMSKLILLMNNESTRNYGASLPESAHMIKYVNKKNRILPPELHALTLTMSDQVEGLAELAQDNPHITFHVAANTRVSPKLLSYEQYKNVKIYPNISFQKLHELFLISSFYLDINYYNEIFDAVIVAASTPLLLMGFKDTIHNPDYVLPDCIFPKGDYNSFAKILYQLSSDSSLFTDYLNLQSEENGKALEILQTVLL